MRSPSRYRSSVHPYETQPGKAAAAHGPLWDPRAESDACGVGMLADLSGKASHRIIEDGLEILTNLTHRGASGADSTTGDGAGILFQMPDEFFRAMAPNLDIELPEPGAYAVAMIFLSPDAGKRSGAEATFEKVVAERGHRMLGWRDVPRDNSALGHHARKKEPVVRQAFIARGDHLTTEEAFERDLYVTRKILQSRIRDEAGLSWPGDFYSASFSCRTVIYKGLLLAWQVPQYYPDLVDERMKSALALVHQRYSTNTFPEWDLAQPFRFMCHNGEINTLQGNVNWMRAREALFKSDVFGEDIHHLVPVIRDNGSDSACFDNVLELLTQEGRPVEHAVAMMMPEAWEGEYRMSRAVRGFFEYHAALMEPWDGPAVIAFTDGRRIGAALDRNGLRPARWTLTRDGLFILASETGVLNLPEHEIAQEGRIKPGRVIMADLTGHRLVQNSEVKETLAARQPYADWVDQNKFSIEGLPESPEILETPEAEILQRQRVFGYSEEDIRMVLAPMAGDGKEPVGSMGVDTPLAVLSDRPRLLYDYFYQHFAQVSNPPIDPIREEMVMSLTSFIGEERNLLSETPEHVRQLEIPHPILNNYDLARVRHAPDTGLRAATVDILFKRDEGLTEALARIRRESERALKQGANVLILSDRQSGRESMPVPALMAVGGVHHHLIRKGLRKRCGLIVESGEPREVHHMALLIGYGANAINPYLALESVRQLARRSDLDAPENAGETDQWDAERAYIQALKKGLLKVFSKMGISTLQSYQGAQIFEAVGLGPELIADCFEGTPSRLGGAGIDMIEKESVLRHEHAFSTRMEESGALEWGGQFHYRAQGERHQWSPMSIANLQKAVREDDAAAYEAFSRETSELDDDLYTIRGLLDIREEHQAIPLDEVEPVESILRRFKTGAMSFGSISAEAHETLAIAMNRMGGKSNSGEGGENESRFTPDSNGDLRRSAIKQVASGRFGVTAHYLVNADEIQIKMAQGAKPGEGGQLPGHKVSVEIAAVRHSTPGVGLISPPPHHDIYSIEDLAQLIFDLKNINPRARICVKLVAKVGVGTIAAGVAKAHADVVLISGHSGGTGAAALSSIHHAGVPWEIGLAETHQVLVDNRLRNRIVVETDGGLRNGRDVVVGALLGAEEFGFSTSALISVGCILLRKCHLNTCSVGVATQRPELRSKFAGDPMHVERYFRFIAGEVRQWMARLGFRTFNEMIGRVDLLSPKDPRPGWKSAHVNLKPLLTPAHSKKREDHYCNQAQDHGLEDQMDHELIARAAPALEKKTKVEHEFAIRNRHRTVGTLLSHEVTRRYGAAGLPEATIHFRFRGAAGQSFGAFLPRGVRFDLVGVANDYVGKGLSGGDITIFPHEDIPYEADMNIRVGNVCLYGATSGKMFVRGAAGERFCVRNSGAHAVVEAVGDHGCEYMTGGRVIVLGRVGRNFAAGMSGGIAYVLRELSEFERRCNQEMVLLERIDNEDESEFVRGMIREHFERTASPVAEELLADWDAAVDRLIKVMPEDYKEALKSGSASRE